MNLNIDEKNIDRMAESDTARQKGRLLVKNGSVALGDVETKRNGGFFLSAAVSDCGTRFPVKVSFDSNGYLSGYNCGCDQTHIWRGYCAHVHALLLYITQSNGNYIEKSRLKSVSSRFLEDLEQELLTNIDEEVSFAMDAGQIHIVPSLVLLYGHLALRFSIGKEKLYIVKNVNELLRSIDNGTTVTYGKDLTLLHSLAAFDKDSAKLIRFIKSSLPLSERAQSYGGYGYAYKDSKLLYIPEQSLEDFFELYLGQALPLSIDGKKYGDILFTDGNPDIKFSLKKDTDGSLVLVLGDNVTLMPLKGGAHNFLLTNTGLYRTEDDYFKTCNSLLKAMGAAKSKQLVFAAEDVHKYFSWLHPRLKRLNMVEESDDISLPAINTLKKKLFVDSVNGDIRLKTEFCYGDETYTDFSKEPSAQRDVAEEYRLVSSLLQMGFVLAEDGYYELADEDMLYDFYYYGVEQLKNSAEIYVSDSFEHMALPSGGQTAFGLRYSAGLLELHISTEDYDRAELLQIMNAVRAKKKFYKLRDGRFVNLKESGVTDAVQILSGLNLSEAEIVKGDATIPAYRAFYIDEVRKNSVTATFERDAAFKKLTRDFKDYKDLDFKPPTTFNGVLRDYQKDGFNWLSFLDNYNFGGILADDMGLGKTIQIIALLLAAKQEETRSLSLVIAPTSLIYNWESEIKRFAPSLTTCLISGPPSKRKEILGDAISNNASITYDVYITTYDTLKRDAEYYEDILFRYVIADEAQYIKNPGTKNAKALKSIKGRTKFALTGTPIENSLSELWSVFDFIMPGYLYGYTEFSKHYETPIVKSEDENAAEELKRQLRPFILRRLKKDVLKELPDKTETVLTADMTDDQRKLYTAYLLEARGELSNDSNEIQLLAMITRLRQICCHPSLFAENYTGGSGKLDLTLETIETALASGHRILLFSQFTSMLAILRKELDKARTPYFYLDGATPSKERMEMSERFNHGENGVFLISLKAGGTGLNLTGADVIIHYDPWWNPAVMEQATGRAHRLGQENKVQVYSLVAKDSIEERIMLLQEKKLALTERVLDGTTASLGKLTREEIASLISDSRGIFDN